MDGIAKIYTPALYMFIPVNCGSSHAFSIAKNFFALNLLNTSKYLSSGESAQFPDARQRAFVNACIHTQ